MDKIVQFSSVTQSCPTLCNPIDCTKPGFPVHHQFLELIQSHVHWVGDIKTSQTPLPLLFLPSIFPSISVFSNESVLISFRVDWLDLLAVQGTLKSLLQHHSSKASIIRHSPFFIVQLSHPYMTTRQTIALTKWSFVGKVMSLLFNMFSRLLIGFLPRSKHVLISCLQSQSAVIFGAQENKICHCFHYFPIYLPWSDGTRCHDLCFLNVEF